MFMSLSSSLLLVGTATGLIHSYDITSHQLLRTISTHKGFSITHLSTMLKPPDLVGHVSLSLSASSSGDSRESIPVRPVAPFQRVRDPKAREGHEVTMMLTPPPSVSFYDTSISTAADTTLRRKRQKHSSPTMKKNFYEITPYSCKTLAQAHKPRVYLSKVG